MPFKFFNIGKANAEIENLEKRVAELTSENAALKENGPEIEAAAETLRKDLAEAQGKIATAESELAAARANVATLTAEKEKLSQDLKAASDKLANPAAIIKESASAQAAAIVASVGHAPIATTPTEPQNEVADIKKLTGLAKVIAIEKAESAARKTKN